MRVPWKELKEAEVEGLRQRRTGKVLPRHISRLRKLLRQCRKDPDSHERICYHGSVALLCESDRDWPSAVKHRRLEISLIQRLYGLMAKEPLRMRRYATQNYRASDLRERRKILHQLTQTITEQSASPSRRPARRPAVRPSREGGGR